MQTATIRTHERITIATDLAFDVLVLDDGVETERLALDLEQHTARLGWLPASLAEVRGLCADLDLPSLGLDRDELVRVLVEYYGVEAHEPFDAEVPCYSMSSDDVDSFAAMLGE